MFQATAAGASEAVDAIKAATECKDFDDVMTDSDSDHLALDPWPVSEHEEIARVQYRHALQRLKAKFPDECCDWTDDGVCSYCRPCPCGQGFRGAWPWVLQRPHEFYELCDCVVAEEHGECRMNERHLYFWAQYARKDGTFDRDGTVDKLLDQDDRNLLY